MKIAKIAKIGKRPVYDITVKDVHHYALENGVVTHNTAVTYSANTIFVITKSQDKAADGELSGWHFTLNIHKSRYVREKSKFPFTVNYESGIKPYSGLLDMAIALGAVVSPTQGWYSRVDLSTGEIEAKKWRKKDTDVTEFWESVLDSDAFKQKVSDRYLLSAGSLVADSDIDDAMGEVDDE
jgi:hypothetical protein